MQKFGDDWVDKPSDAIQWVLEAAPPDSSLYELCIRILYIGVSAIHTSAISITNALYDLAAHPEFQNPIRDEIERVLEEYGGWKKQALAKMKNLDSSLKESLRLHPVTTATMMRKAKQHYIFADGTHLPKDSTHFGFRV
jgi:cytochrome P450